MKTATLKAVTAGDRTLEWSWHCASDGASSSRSFPYYYECLADARDHGYSVDLVHASGATAPGGSTYSLDRREP